MTRIVDSNRKNDGSTLQSRHLFFQNACAPSTRSPAKRRRPYPWTATADGTYAPTAKRNRAGMPKPLLCRLGKRWLRGALEGWRKYTRADICADAIGADRLVNSYVRCVAYRVDLTHL